MARKSSGGRYKKFRKKKLFERTGQTRTVKLGKGKKKGMRGMGGRIKTVLLSANTANVLDKKTGKCKIVAIKKVIETPANKFLARQNVLIKGAIIETEIGNARITNRPSQESFVNAVLVSEKKE
ncbi:MAG: 30S ribosomal protein S8e [archaeon]